MAEPTLPSPPPPPADKGNGAHVWFPTSNPNLQGSTQAPAGGYGWINPPPCAAGRGPYGAGACSFGFGPYGCGHRYHCPRPAQPQSQVNVNVNWFVENKSKVQGQTSFFALVRRGTGVFHPPPRVQFAYNRKHSKNKNRGTWRSKSASKGNDGLVKQEECDPHTPTSEMRLPKEWTY